MKSVKNVLFSYRKLYFSYRKLHFSYQKLHLSCQKLHFSYRKLRWIWRSEFRGRWSVPSLPASEDLKWEGSPSKSDDPHLCKIQTFDPPSMPKDIFESICLLQNLLRIFSTSSQFPNHPAQDFGRVDSDWSIVVNRTSFEQKVVGSNPANFNKLLPSKSYQTSKRLIYLLGHFRWVYCILLATMSGPNKLIH